MTEGKKDPNKEVVIVSSETGKLEEIKDLDQFIIISGIRLESFERKIINIVKKPFRALLLLLGILFVIMIGGAIFLSSLNNTVNNTDSIVTGSVSPASKAAQAKAVSQILNEVDCREQRNLQHFVDKLISAGLIQLNAVGPLVEKRCELIATTKSTTTTVTTIDTGVG